MFHKPEEYKSLAEWLENQDIDTTICSKNVLERTVINRCYYAAFYRVINFLNDNPYFKRSKSKTTHKSTIDELHEEAMRANNKDKKKLLNKAHSLLIRLLRQRTKADYEPDTKINAKSCLEDSNEIFQILAQVLNTGQNSETIQQMRLKI